MESEVTVDRPASAPSSPTDLFGGAHRKGRRVNFPTDDLIVSSYCEAPVPQTPEKDTDSPVRAYKQACNKHGVQPLPQVVELLESYSPFEENEHTLDLTGQELNPYHCETLEEVFKRIHFKKVILEGCGLKDEGAAAIFDMIEYYECADQLCIANNPGIENRGWQACCKMLKKCPSLQYLDCRGTCQSDQTLLILGRALRSGCHLVTLHLEHCHLAGRPLVILVAALKLNPSVRELFLGHNGIRETDGIQLGTLLRSGGSRLQLLDLRTNGLADLGTCHLVDGLCQGGAKLTSLSLRDNGLSPLALKYLARALESPSTHLQTLDLSYNSLTNQGLLHLKRPLKSNRVLETLGLAHTAITCEGAVELAEILADNLHLVTLDLRGNNVQMTGLTALASAALTHPRLASLQLDPPHAALFKNSEDVESYNQLLKQIEESCQKNALEEEEKMAKEQVQPHVNIVTPPPPTVALTNEVDSPPLTPPSPKSRFQVSRVVLDSDSVNGSASPPPPPPPPPSLDGGIKSCLTDRSKLGASPSPKSKKLGFLLPGELPTSPHRIRKDRRMSTPAVPISGPSNTRRMTLNLKFCKRLESLDLRSSVPLSPTRLMEAWEFPEPPNWPASSNG